MKIVHYFAGRVNPEAGKVGSVHVLYYLSMAQVEKGHVVEWYLAPRKENYENRGDGVKIFDFGRASFFGLIPPISLLLKILRKRKSIDLVHLHGPFTQENILVAIILLFLGVPYIISSHGSFSPGAMQGKYILKLIYKYMFAIPICNFSKAVHVHTDRDLLEAREFGVRGKCIVAEHGSDHIWKKPKNTIRTEITSPSLIDSRKFNLLFLGRLDPWHKGLDILLQALQLLDQTAVHLYLIGPEKKRFEGKLDELIATLKLESCVTRLPPVYDIEKKVSWYSSVDLFAHPSRFDVFPMAIYEALAAGCPVLVTPGTQADDFVRLYETGFVSDLNPVSLAESIRLALSSPKLMGTYRKNASTAIKERTWSQAWEKIDAQTPQ